MVENSSIQKHIIIIGCGNIGFRHLQSVLALDIRINIEVIEPQLALHKRIEDEVLRVNNPNAKVQVHTMLWELEQHFDLAILAMNSKDRFLALEKLLTAHTVSTIILEKVLFQTFKELDDAGKLCKQKNTRAYVNCGRRAFPSYQVLKQYIQEKNEMFDVFVSGSSFGLASNGIHFFDLAEFLNSSFITNIDASELKEGFISSKRAGNIEVFGKLSANLANGAKIHISCGQNETPSIHVILRSNDLELVIDEINSTISENSILPSFEMKRVSEMTNIYESLLMSGDCVLTPYKDSANQHKHSISALRSHLNMSNDTDEPCPIS